MAARFATLLATIPIMGADALFGTGPCFQTCKITIGETHSCYVRAEWVVLYGHAAAESATSSVNQQCAGQCSCNPADLQYVRQTRKVFEAQCKAGLSLEDSRAKAKQAITAAGADPQEVASIFDDADFQQMTDATYKAITADPDALKCNEDCDIYGGVYTCEQRTVHVLWGAALQYQTHQWTGTAAIAQVNDQCLGQCACRMRDVKPMAGAADAAAFSVRQGQTAQQVVNAAANGSTAAGGTKADACEAIGYAAALVAQYGDLGQNTAMQLAELTSKKIGASSGQIQLAGESARRLYRTAGFPGGCDDKCHWLGKTYQCSGRTKWLMFTSTSHTTEEAVQKVNTECKSQCMCTKEELAPIGKASQQTHACIAKGGTPRQCAAEAAAACKTAGCSPKDTAEAAGTASAVTHLAHTPPGGVDSAAADGRGGMADDHGTTTQQNQAADAARVAYAVQVTEVTEATPTPAIPTPPTPTSPTTPSPATPTPAIPTGSSTPAPAPGSNINALGNGGKNSVPSGSSTPAPGPPGSDINGLDTGGKTQPITDDTDVIDDSVDASGGAGGSMWWFILLALGLLCCLPALALGIGSQACPARVAPVLAMCGLDGTSKRSVSGMAGDSQDDEDEEAE